MTLTQHMYVKYQPLRIDIGECVLDALKDTIIP